MAGQQPRPGEPEQARLRIRGTLRWSVAAAHYESAWCMQTYSCLCVSARMLILCLCICLWCQLCVRTCISPSGGWRGGSIERTLGLQHHAAQRFSQADADHPEKCESAAGCIRAEGKMVGVVVVALILSQLR